MAILFARLQADVPLKMRRGAWYRVIQLTDLQAVIEINHRKVGVLRAWLEIAQRPPLRWSVVHGSAENRKAPPHLRGTYGVCPNCRARAPLQTTEWRLRTHPQLWHLARCAARSQGPDSRPE